MLQNQDKVVFVHQNADFLCCCFVSLIQKQKPVFSIITPHAGRARARGGRAGACGWRAGACGWRAGGVRVRAGACGWRAGGARVRAGGVRVRAGGVRVARGCVRVRAGGVRVACGCVRAACGCARVREKRPGDWKITFFVASNRKSTKIRKSTLR